MFVAALAFSCKPPTVFECSANAECTFGGEQGRCEPTGFCSFADGTCASGQRYGEFAGDGFANECLDGMFLSPTGNDSGEGTEDDPWQTFQFSLGQLEPGDTLIALDGVYSNRTGTGDLDVDCDEPDDEECNGSPCPDGLPGAPITVRAAHERQAFLLGDEDSDLAVLQVNGCSYWEFEGFHVEFEDDVDFGSDESIEGDCVAIVDAQNIELRKLLTAKPSREHRSHNISVFQSDNVLIEDTEAYDFHSDAVIVEQSRNVTARRVYVNSRGRRDLSGGETTDPPNEGDGGIVFQSCTSSRIENSIAESTAFGIGTSTYTPASSNVQVLGCAAFDVDDAFFAVSECDGDACDPDRDIGNATRFENCVAAQCTGTTCVFIGGGNDTVLSHVTIDGMGMTDVVHFDKIDVGGYEPNATISDSLIVNGQTAATSFSPGQWEVATSNVFVTGNPFSQGVNVDAATTQIDPQLGQCLAYIPNGSPMAGAASDGEDIGATILNRYVDGVLSEKRLWGSSGEFPCGAIVEGVNDNQGSSCIGVHLRLRVGAQNGCPIP